MGPSRVATTVGETAFTTRSAAAAGTAGEIRPDPMWLQGFDIDRETGRLYLAVGAYGAATDDRPRGTIRVGHSDDGGRTWSFSRLPPAPDVDGHRQSSIRPNLVAGPGYVLVTFHTLDDVAARATVGNAISLSADGGSTWQTALAGLGEALVRGVTGWRRQRHRAPRACRDPGGRRVFWAYGDGRFASASATGRVAVVGARIDVGVRP